MTEAKRVWRGERGDARNQANALIADNALPQMTEAKRVWRGERGDARNQANALIADNALPRMTEAKRVWRGERSAAAKMINAGIRGSESFHAVPGGRPPPSGRAAGQLPLCLPECCRKAPCAKRILPDAGPLPQGSGKEN